MKHVPFGSAVRDDAALRARVQDPETFSAVVAATADPSPDASLVYDALQKLRIVVGDRVYSPVPTVAQWGNSATVVCTTAGPSPETLMVKAPYARPPGTATPAIPEAACDVVATTAVFDDTGRRGLDIMEHLDTAESTLPGLVSWMKETAMCLLDAGLVYTDWKLANIAAADDSPAFRLVDTESIFSLSEPSQGTYPTSYLHGLSPIGPLEAPDARALVLVMAWGVVVTSALIDDLDRIDDLAPQTNPFGASTFFSHLAELATGGDALARRAYAGMHEIWSAYASGEDLPSLIAAVRSVLTPASPERKRRRMASFIDLTMASAL